MDLDTGAILNAQVRPGDQADQKDLAAHVLEAQENINQARNLPAGTLTIESATADKGYHAVEEMGFLQREGIRTVISDPVRNRDRDKLTDEQAKAVHRARRSARSKSGKALLRKRGMHIERFFAHGLDAGGARRTTLRGLANLNKRFKLTAAIYNLSQLMRKLLGVGTPKQWAAWGKAFFLLLWRLLLAGRSWMAAYLQSQLEKYWPRLVAHVEDADRALFREPPAVLTFWHISTGC